jgi:hypothetical protein
MAGFRDKYKVSAEAMTEGKWVDLGDGVRVRVVRADNTEARKLRMLLERPYRGRDIPVSKLEEITSVTIARTVLKDWEGVTDDGGNAIPFSPDEATRIFKKYPDFRDDVAVVSMDREMFRMETLEEDAGN